MSQCAYKVVWLTKETDETEDWLLLYKYSENYIFDDSLLEEIKEIQKIINSTINTSKSK